MAFVITPKKTHTVELTNEEFYYVSELLANRGKQLEGYKENRIKSGLPLRLLNHEISQVDSLISGKFISI